MEEVSATPLAPKAEDKLIQVMNMMNIIKAMDMHGVHFQAVFFFRLGLSFWLILCKLWSMLYHVYGCHVYGLRPESTMSVHVINEIITIIY